MESALNRSDIEALVKKIFIDEDRTCSEAFLQAGAGVLGIESPLIPDIAIGLAGGVGREGHICGMVSGSAMVISLAASSVTADYASRKSLILDLTGAFTASLQKETGSIFCRDICGLDLNTEEGNSQFNLETKKDRCLPKMKSACRLLAETLEELIG
jgi:C_GCAxxG_C_C family probable redox protein